ncbi:uncharacterized protein A1O9_06342, partial [Exophiala aquamarina CBS 119918]
RSRSTWESSFTAPMRSYQPQPHRSPVVTRDPMDPESSDSDVSVGGGDEYRFASPLTAPVPLPAPPSKHALESSDAVSARLDELLRVEEHNIKKYDLLKAKRNRKDDKIRRKREAQDKKMAAIMEGRQRRDARIEARRKREDAAFASFDHELEEEEHNLRRRLKRLKRGLPPDESPRPGAARISSASMSPPVPGLSTIPPPPKRHQVGPPGQPDAVNPAQSRPVEQRPVPPAKTTEPPYSFYRSMNSTYNRPYHQGPYSTSPNTASPVANTNGLNHPSQPPPDRSSLNPLGHPGSPRSRPPSSAHSPATPVTHANPPPRVTSSSYDTRPPPTTTSSGFASVNAPVTTGFAPINPRSAATPPAAHTGLARPLQDSDHKTPNQPVGSNGMDSTRFHSYTSTPSTTPTLAANTASKRTPSTTHPYQMSEAFANRHHHCERVDGLNRGIWTSYGVGGTQENPTGPATEMYLRCNHDGCSRIDWRTVHGLQCHIVKNHEQPKGTIGSLDKALEKYGVPVKDVEDYEREHGRGSAGTVADPKNHKIKVKTKEALTARPYARTGTPGSYGVDPQARPAGYRPSLTPTSDSPTLSDELKRSPVTGLTNGAPKDAPINQPPIRPTQGPPTVTGPSSMTSFSSVPAPQMRSDYRPDWIGRPIQMQTPSRLEPDQKKLQGDFGASSLPSPTHPNGPSTTRPGPVDRPALSTRSPVVHAAIPATIPATPTAPEPPKPAVAEAKIAPATVPVAGIPVTAPLAPDAPLVTSETKQIQPKYEQEESNGIKQNEAPAQEADKDTPMTGTDHRQADKPNSVPNGDGKTAQTSSNPTSNTPEDNGEDQSETIVIDGETGKANNETSGTKKSNLQSPTIMAKALPASAPGSARRPSRRLSVARKSVDGDGDPAYAKENRVTTSTNGETDDKDDKDSKDEREK